MTERKFEYVAILGSRDFDLDKLYMVGEFIDEFLDPKRHVIVSGGARGVDKRAELVARREGFQFVEAPAIWSRGKSAGFARNAVIVDIADRFAFFWDGKSKGTKHAIDLVREVPKPLLVLQ